MMKFFLLLIFFFISSASFCQVWNPYFGDTLYSSSGGIPVIYNLYVQNNNMYIGGAFGYAGPKIAQGIVIWRNYQWDTLCYGLYAPAKGMLFYNNKFYVGGNFWEVDTLNNGYGQIPNTRYLASWNGSRWFALTNFCPNNEVKTLCKYDNNLYVGGSFNQIGSTWYGKITRWDGAYHQVGTQGLTLNGTSYVSSMLIYNNKLIVGGYFSADSLNNIATWDGSQWGKIGNGLNSYVNRLLVDTVHNWLYAGGAFYLLGDSLTQGGWGIAKWDSTKWEIVGGGSNCDIVAMEFYRGNLFVSGCFDTIGGKRITSFAKWNGQAWDSVPGGPDGYYSAAEALIVYNDELILGGTLRSINGQPAHGLARYYEPPDSACLYFSPAIYTDADTFYLHNDTVGVQFYSNSFHGSAWNWNFGDSGTDTVRMPRHVYTSPGTYSVSLTLTEAQCTKTAHKTIVVSDDLSVNPKEELRIMNYELKIYPNPSSNTFSIEVSNAGQAGSILRITNPTGAIQKEYVVGKPNEKIMVNTTGWKSGTYICNLLIGGKVVKTEKMVLEK
jgi:hypothetical protein